MTNGVYVLLACLIAGCETTSSSTNPPALTSPDAGLPKADAGPTIDAGPPSTCDAPGPETSLSDLKEESVRRLTTLLGAGAGLDTGTLYFQEMVSNAELFAAPAGDQSAIIYVPNAVPSDQLPMAAFSPGRPYVPAVFWGLNGTSRVMFTDATTLSTVGVDRRFAVGAILTLKTGTSEADANTTVMDLKTRFGADGATWSLLAGGVVIFDFPSTTEESPVIDAVEARRYALTLRALSYVKNLANVGSIELNGSVYHLPIRTWPAAQLPVSSSMFKPECLRTESRFFRDYPGAFITLPGLAAPFGSGLSRNTNPPFDPACFPFGQVDKVCWEEKHRSGP